MNAIKSLATSESQQALTSSKNLLYYHYIKTARTQENTEGFYINSLVNISWECKYTIVLAPKYRIQILYGKMKAEIGKYLENDVKENESGRMSSESYIC